MMIELDGTNNKSKLGANAILSVSMHTHVQKLRVQESFVPIFRRGQMPIFYRFLA